MANLNAKIKTVIDAGKGKKLGDMPTMKAGASEQEISAYEAAMTTWLINLDKLYDECLAEDALKFSDESKGSDLGDGPP